MGEELDELLSKITPENRHEEIDYALTLNEYQRISTRSANPHKHELINYGLGIAGEAGEVADLIKKSMFHGHNVDKDEIKKELGDVMWYLSQIARLAGLTLEEIAEANIEKLKKRYPDGFSTEASINRKAGE
ncbi:nucleoside triphosphate pyrophosphohydrolase family protein [Lederbergia citri]|uniref:Nucleoside triphosphate pyrophosphohydrolase family protein n=1 Tax=Lederbergia citri TaxID=2833580 RepID=A0A942TF96_9BACI|nr:nucleoside triphosphate pyrophosphohydrolase family protein [Lederbergia citri]MBS4195354.1 nucleoside triphosphate pyrophosphohydrolase family protein [Lederbergia citri]